MIHVWDRDFSQKVEDTFHEANAMRLRDAVEHHPLLSRYMRCLTTADLIPAGYRPTGIERPLRSGLANMIRAWETDEFVLDPSRITKDGSGQPTPGRRRTAGLLPCR